MSSRKGGEVKVSRGEGTERRHAEGEGWKLEAEGEGKRRKAIQE